MNKPGELAAAHGWPRRAYVIGHRVDGPRDRSSVSGDFTCHGVFAGPEGVGPTLVLESAAGELLAVDLARATRVQLERREGWCCNG